MLAKIAAAATAGIATILSTVRMAFAVSTDTRLSPEYIELLRLAHEKVHAATQPGALGNGVPVLFGADPVTLLPWIGVTISAAVGAVCAAKILVPKTRNDALLAR